MLCPLGWEVVADSCESRPLLFEIREELSNRIVEENREKSEEAAVEAKEFLTAGVEVAIEV